VNAAAQARIVFDTNVVLSALLFTHGRLSWLLSHWQARDCVPLVSRATGAELTRILSYPKFQLSTDEQLEALGGYIPFCEVVDFVKSCTVLCRDSHDQPFLDLAQSGKAEVLVTGDEDLLVLSGQAAFFIETPEAYRQKMSRTE
jgi:putative PIN family toxin of toxin-antitoxin system